MASRVIPVEVPLDLAATLQPLGSVWAVRRPDGWWRPVRTPEGAATLQLRRDPQRVHARAWGSGGDWVLERVPEWIGLADRPEDLVTDHPLVARLQRQERGARFGRSGLMFDPLLTAIVSQKVTGKEASRTLRALGNRFSEAAPGPLPGLTLPPDPGRLASAPYHLFHPLGLERRRAEVLRRVAAAAHRLEPLAGSEPAAVRAALERFPGIGVWTSAETVAVSHGDPDAVSVGDFHLKHVVAWHLAGEPRGTDERMLELLAPFQGHRGQVVRLLERHGRYPRYGPRMPVRDFRTF